MGIILAIKSLYRISERVL